jgi:hypothetical protein
LPVRRRRRRLGGRDASAIRVEPGYPDLYAPRVAIHPEREPPAEDGSAQPTAQALLENVEQVVLGKHDEVALVLAALVGGGHVLLEDVPGTAKTVLARAIAQTIRGSSARPTCSRPT